MISEPPWLQLARTYLGVREIPGARHESRIVQWWRDIGSAIRDDETPYCAAFVGAMFERCSIRSTRSAAARSYLKFGVALSAPVVGAVVVFSRPGCSWCGHVGFTVGRDSGGNILTLGANQSNTVSVAPFRADRVLGYRFPAGVPVPVGGLPLLASTGPISINEA